MNSIKIELKDSAQGWALIRAADGRADLQVDPLSVGFDMRGRGDIVVLLEGDDDLHLTVTYAHGDTVMVAAGPLHLIGDQLRTAGYTVKRDAPIQLDVYCPDCGRAQPDETSPFCHFCHSEVPA